MDNLFDNEAFSLLVIMSNMVQFAIDTFDVSVILQILYTILIPDFYEVITESICSQKLIICRRTNENKKRLKCLIDSTENYRSQ